MSLVILLWVYKVLIDNFPNSTGLGKFIFVHILCYAINTISKAENFRSFRVKYADPSGIALVLSFEKEQTSNRI